MIYICMVEIGLVFMKKRKQLRNEEKMVAVATGFSMEINELFPTLIKHACQKQQPLCPLPSSTHSHFCPILCTSFLVSTYTFNCLDFAYINHSILPSYLFHSAQTWALILLASLLTYYFMFFHMAILIMHLVHLVRDMYVKILNTYSLGHVYLALRKYDFWECESEEYKSTQNLYLVSGKY